MKKLLFIILFFSVTGFVWPAYPTHTFSTHTELKPVSTSYKLAKSHFLPDYQASPLRFEGGDLSYCSDKFHYTTANCHYPAELRNRCPGTDLYSECTCPPTYFSEEECMAQGKVGGGTQCNGSGGIFYSQCRCPDDYEIMGPNQVCASAAYICSYEGESYCREDKISCRSGFRLCEGNLVGSGSSCRDGDGLKYEDCVCDRQTYDKTEADCRRESGDNAELSGQICRDDSGGVYGTFCSCEASCPSSYPDRICGSLGAAGETDDGCGGKCYKCNTCSPTCSDETNCPNGTEVVSDGCGGSCTVCKKDDGTAVIFTFSPDQNNVSLTLPTASYSGVTTNYTVDWGDGSVDKDLTTFNPTHTYAKAGNYDVTITGSLGKLGQFSSSNIKYVTRIKKLNLSSIKELNATFWVGYPTSTKSNITGTIPELPAGLKVADTAFRDCSGLTGSIPELPSELENGYSMFSGCKNLTGSIPKLPTRLKTISNMFSSCENLTGSIPQLPTGVTNAFQTFIHCKNLTGSIPKLPEKLENGERMFESCSRLTGNIPTLPEGLTNGHRMFAGCRGLTGNIPKLPTSLKDGGSMFQSCTGLTGNIPELPEGLEEAGGMFWNCSGLTGNAPELPAALKNTGQMFDGCCGLTGDIPKIPQNITNVYRMFNGCNGLTGVTTVNGQYPYQYLINIKGSYGRDMVSGCSDAVRSKFPQSWGGTLPD